MMKQLKEFTLVSLKMMEKTVMLEFPNYQGKKEGGQEHMYLSTNI